MPANPVEAGRKGGSRNTPAQQAARKRNGFQKVKPAESETKSAQPICTRNDAALFTQNQEPQS